MRYYCNVCKKTITKKVYDYSMEKYKKALCMNHQKQNTISHPKKSNYSSYQKTSRKSKVTPQARKLYNALRKRGISCKLEAYDGYKHVDISIPWVGLDIEIDGKHHIFNSRQLYSDIERTYHSQDEDDVRTIRIPNDFIDKDVTAVANSIAKVARRKYRKEEDDFW